jgi:hypothetical protein
MLNSFHSYKKTHRTCYKYQSFIISKNIEIVSHKYTQ